MPATIVAAYGTVRAAEVGELPKLVRRVYDGVGELRLGDGPVPIRPRLPAGSTAVSSRLLMLTGDMSTAASMNELKRRQMRRAVKSRS